MSATDINQLEGDLIPLSAFIVAKVYGDAEYLTSVFGTANINRRQLQQYYQQAEQDWCRIPIMRAEVWRSKINIWLRENNIGALDYYFPLGQKSLWFKHQTDAFAFALKFAIIDK
jgi:hypothetical protein